MQRRLTWILFLLLTGGTIAIAAKVIRAELDGPPPFGRAELEFWLASPTPDASPAVRRRAARQLDMDFHAEFDWQPTLEALPKERRSAFVVNFQSLMQLLLEQRADAYRAEPPYRREAFLDAQLQDLTTWYAVGTRGKQDGLSLFREGLVALHTGSTSQRSSPKTREFLTALQAHVIKRSLERLMPAENR